MTTSRRLAFGVAALAAAASALALTDSAAAARGRTYPSRDSFQLECELLGGAFFREGTGSGCIFEDGSSILCGPNFRDKNNCHYHRPFPAPDPTVVRGETVRASGSEPPVIQASPGSPTTRAAGVPSRHAP